MVKCHKAVIHSYSSNYNKYCGLVKHRFNSLFLPALQSKGICRLTVYYATNFPELEVLVLVVAAIAVAVVVTVELVVVVE